MSNEYRIESLLDFTKIPAERRAAALAEFQEWLACVEAVQALNHAFSSSEDVCLQLRGGCFIWTDDGKPGITGVTISINGASETVAI